MIITENRNFSNRMHIVRFQELIRYPVSLLDIINIGNRNAVILLKEMLPHLDIFIKISTCKSQILNRCKTFSAPAEKIGN